MSTYIKLLSFVIAWWAVENEKRIVFLEHFWWCLIGVIWFVIKLSATKTDAIDNEHTTECVIDSQSERSKQKLIEKTFKWANVTQFTAHTRSNGHALALLQEPYQFKTFSIPKTKSKAYIFRVYAHSLPLSLCVRLHSNS